VGPFATILNVFPKEDLRENGLTQPVKFYWYSQVIGPNRSLEILLEAASLLNEPFELHLRGKFNNGEYEKLLKGKVKNMNIENNVFFYEPIVAEEIIKDASKYDVGLAIETDISFNRNICVTNKVFSYLMSGLAIVGSDTDGQLDIFSHFADAVQVCRKNDTKSLGEAMLYFIRNPEALMRSKQAAKQAARDRYNQPCFWNISEKH
jgi:glycosyltransferase involved in cell wall biosynthesis